ncbi:MAG TPA: glycosyltransferase family 4 protein [Candidatus Fermentibacter daniensis]|nr:MAG: putative teichuronic acid biosynthesis glycosyltransferase TuaC [candidate division Hyd24-12 bacterium ADurb.Bin004]HOF66692.1 glycosyltransferase family 4 protein [Candidatus Fermentibacter daniensis]HOR07778.1 glycosyltransferase family 4 protein [Candidatus Fermentibacter daniensis]HOZ18629.1 glycosyltransferase family 4 protein [Candidatus Fermentibacter daniensis]HPH40521.1 glycosyltransferase family 4 protein [Candidatus Fermentibacter daniensis]
MPLENDPLRVVVLAEASPDDAAAVGGVGGFLRALSGHMPPGWVLLTPSPGPDDAPCHLGPSLAGCRLPHRIVFPLRLLLHIGRLSRLRPGLVYTHSNEAAMLLCLLRSVGLVRWRLVHHQHGSENPLTYATFGIGRRFGLPAAYDRVLGWMHRAVDRVVAIDERCLAENIRWGVPPERVVLLPNAVDTELFRPSEELRASFREALGIPAGAFLFCFAGRIEEVKRVGLLLDSFEILEGSPWLVIAGEGSLRGNLERRAALSPASGRIVFTGALGPGSMPSLYAASDCLVLPSAAEGIPLVILEGMSTGVPVVATAVGGVPGLLDPSCGILVDPSPTTRDLAKALSEAMETDWDRAAVRARAAGFSAVRAVSLLNALFRGVCGRDTPNA